MGEDSDRREHLIESIADGNALDWDVLDAEAGADPVLRQMLDDLRLIAGVAAVHRSVLADADTIAIRRPDSTGASTTSPASAAAPSFVADGTQWGHLLLVSKIGEGAFGEVFHARDTWLDHGVALKLLKPHLQDVSRLLHEARTLAKIRHENVVRVHGADVHDGRIGFWMEFVQGHTLADVVAREGVRSANEATVIGQDLCRALAAVHAQDIAHRDIKAKNVMREAAGGRVVLMDFGAGEPMKGGLGRSQLTGTPLYLAPELLDGGPATPQSDIYALGVLLFYLVTGKYPVLGSSFEDLIRAHKQNERLRLVDARPDLPDSFVTVVETMLSPDLTQRYATAATALAALDGTVRHPLPNPWIRMVAGVATGLAAITLAGYLASSLFNLPLELTEGFESESVLLWPVWGFRALFAAALVMALVAMPILVLRILCSGLLSLSPSLRRRCHSFMGTVRSSFERVPVPTLASSLLMAQLIAVGLFVWRFQDVIGSIDAFVSRREPADLSSLAPNLQYEHIQFDVFNCVIVLVFGLAWYRLARRGWAKARAFIASGMAITALMLLVWKVVPFKIIYHNEAERVSYGDQRCYLMGTRGTEVRLFCPVNSPPWNRIVPIDDPSLKREGVTENIFTVFNQSPKGQVRK